VAAAVGSVRVSIIITLGVIFNAVTSAFIIAGVVRHWHDK
jgi:hypothetical protein